MSRRVCMGMSADVDRHPDAYLRKRVCPGLRKDDGTHPTVLELRAACAEARARGLEVLPSSCTNPDAKGYCQGHEVPAEPCRRCSECIGQEHHFLPIADQDDKEDGTVEIYYPCKHCDARLPFDDDDGDEDLDDEAAS